MEWFNNGLLETQFFVWNLILNPDMKIKHLTVKNFKSFSELSLDFRVSMY